MLVVNRALINAARVNQGLVPTPKELAVPAALITVSTVRLTFLRAHFANLDLEQQAASRVLIKTAFPARKISTNALNVLLEQLLTSKLIHA